ncbi:MAG: hypothetical protein OXH38_05620, partial [Chloroflexi bacterium]|nr:hypothetical protein [Chloroflexota bacterium]
LQGGIPSGVRISHKNGWIGSLYDNSTWGAETVLIGCRHNRASALDASMRDLLFLQWSWRVTQRSMRLRAREEG